MNTLVLGQKEVIQAGIFQTKDIIKIIEETLIEYGKGQVVCTDKISQIFDFEIQNRINCMPATLINKDISGLKWVSVFPENPSKFEIPNVTGVIILSEIISGLPITYMDATLITSVRTAGVGAIASKYLAKNKCEIIGFIGAGEQAKMHFVAIKEIKPEIRVCKVSSKTAESERALVEELSLLYPDVEFISCNRDNEDAVRNSDIVVTATSAQQPLLKEEWIAKGTLYIHVGGWEDEYNVALKSNKIVCDDWESVKSRTQTLSRLYQDGLINDTDIYADIHEIISDDKKGRESESEIIYFNSVGLGCIDIALANYIYQRARNLKIGVEIPLNYNYDLRKVQEKYGK